MRHADVGGLRIYCNMAKDTDGLPNMQKLGRNRLNDLPPEGVCVCVCVCAHMYDISTACMHTVCCWHQNYVCMYVRIFVTIVWAEYYWNSLKYRA